MKKIILPAALFFCALQISFSQSIKFDSSFGVNGIVETSIGQNYNYGSLPVTQIIPLDNGTYVIQGSLTKRRINGSIDSDFGHNGFSADAGFPIAAAALQSDGKIVVVGTDIINQDNDRSRKSDFEAARFNKDGSLDSSFSEDGKVRVSFNTYHYYESQEEGRSIAIQKDGKIVVAGISNFNPALARFNTNGTLDTTFSFDGMLNGSGDITSIAIQNDGKIVAVGGSGTGTDFQVSRININGSLDKTFGDHGIQITDFFSQTDIATAVSIQSDGKIIAAGYTARELALARYNIDGSLDKSFSADGKQTSGQFIYYNIKSVAIQNDGKIVVAGSKDGGAFAVERYNIDGSLDESFSHDGMLTTDFGIPDHDDYLSGAYAVAIQSDGKIVAGGEVGGPVKFSALARYNNDGSLDNTFDKDGKLVYGFKSGNTTLIKTAVQKDGKIVAAGYTWKDSSFVSFIARYETSGVLDKTFNQGGLLYPSFSIASVAIQSDGKILLAGSAFKIARYNTDGSIDNTFSNDGIQTTDFGDGTYNSQAKSIAIQNDGKIIVVGETSMYKGETDEDGESMAIARYNTDGRIDWKSVRNLFLYSSAEAVAVQNDGKIVVGGYVDEPTYFQDFALIRYNSDGSPDYAFGNDGEQETRFDVYLTIVNSIAIQSDGKIIAVGTATNEEDKQIAIARYTADGMPDTSFSDDGVLMTNYNRYANANSVAVQDNGKIVVAGTDLLRYNSDGSLDSTFADIEKQTPHFYINSITILNNKLNAVGTINHNPEIVGVVVRYLLDDEKNTPPTVTLTAPTNNATYLAPAAHIKLSAAASDTDGTISKVEFYNGNTLLHTETIIPYGYVWRNVPLGNYTITAKAYDNSGNATTSAAVHISVVPNKAPTVSIVSPANNQVFADTATIRLIASATDTDGRITRVEFYKDSTLLRTEYKYPYTYNWTNVPAGSYVITAVATDNWGAHTTSAEITVLVKSQSAIVSSRPYSETEKTALNDALSLRLSPNPANNVVNIFVSELQLTKPATLSIISVSGIVLKNIQISKGVTQLNVSSLVSGVYTIKIVSGEKVLYKQFVKL